MRLFIFLSFFILNTSLAEVGKVLKVVGSTDAYLVRDQNKISLTVDQILELGDEIFSENSMPVIHLYPGTQLSLAKNSQIKLIEHMIEENAEAVKKSSSVIDFIRGILRASITREEGEEVDQKFQARGVAFGVRGTEFEVSEEGEDEIDLDVFEGSVEVSSPDVHTFVPEIVKANEGFKFSRKQRKFARRKFSPKFKNHPGFENKKQLRQQWKEMRKQRRVDKGVDKQARAERKSEKKSERQNRKNNKEKKGSRDK